MVLDFVKNLLFEVVEESAEEVVEGGNVSDGVTDAIEEER